MRYVVAIVFAVLAFILTIGLMAVIFGQAFDGITGASGYIPVAGELVVAGAAAICGFRVIVPVRRRSK